MLLAPIQLLLLTTQSPQQYSLPPDKLRRAVEYAHAGYSLHFASEVYAIVILAAIVATGLSAKFRDWAEAASKRRFVQALIFIPLVLVTNDLLYLPANIFGQHLERKFDQSIQSWPSWFWDWTKSELIAVVCAVPLIWILYAVIRRSPRRWWLYFWLSLLPILFFVSFVEPFVVEPMFFKFAPLARMFWMNPSEQTPTMNAYVSGLGASKRVVVWDNNLAKEPPPEIVSD